MVYYFRSGWLLSNIGKSHCRISIHVLLQPFDSHPPIPEPSTHILSILWIRCPIWCYLGLSTLHLVSGILLLSIMDLARTWKRLEKVARQCDWRSIIISKNQRDPSVVSQTRSYQQGAVERQCIKLLSESLASHIKALLGILADLLLIQLLALAWH